MTYFLQKKFELNHNGKIVPYHFDWHIVSPCDFSYEKCLGIIKNKGELWLKGSCATYDIFESEKMSYDEWLINISLHKGILLDFEEHIFVDTSNNSYRPYVMKIIDLHTNKVLRDYSAHFLI